MFIIILWTVFIDLEQKLESHENVCKNYDYFLIEMPEKGKILKYKKSLKVVFVIYADTEFLFEKIDTWHNNPMKGQQQWN